MKKFALTIFYISLFFLVLGLFSSCVQNSGSGTIADNRKNMLRVGITPDSPPLVYENSGKVQGLEVDLANQLGTYLGKEVQLVRLAWDRQISALEEGKIDIIMSGMTITKDRSYRVAFTQPYLQSGQILLVRTNQALKYSSGIYSLMGNQPSIGVIENTTGDYFITTTINRPDLTRFKTPKAAVEALIEGRIDAIVHDAPILCYYAAMHEGSVTPILQMATVEHLAWAVNKMDSELLDSANAFLDLQTINGELQKTIKRWIPYM